MTSKPSSQVSPPRLGLHVINGGWGESIVLELPDERWGVIDCYAPSLTDSSTNETLRFLQQRQVTELEFVALTHPHTDHFRGLSQLFDALPVNQFWRYAATTPKDLASFQVGAAAQSAVQTQDQNAQENADDLLRLLRLTTTLRKRNRLKFKHCEDEKTLYRNSVPIGTAESVDLSIRCIAPSSDDVERYQQMLRRCFDADHRLRLPAPALPHNLISSAFTVEFGETRLILGGDVEAAGWRTIIQEQGTERLKAQCVKVSHHGSRNGYCPGLWAVLSDGSETIAIITPYQQQELPEEAAYQHIRDHTSYTVTTCRPAISFSTQPQYDLWPHFDARVQLGIRAFFPDFRADKGYAPGRCSFYFDPHQNRVEYGNEYWGEAGPI